MNKSMLVGTVLGAVAATAVGSFAGYKMLNKEEFAEVVAVTPLTEQVKTPREECHNETVTKQAPVKDEHRVTGTVIGAVAGGLLGNAIGGHGSNTGAKVIGAAAGGVAGHEVQRKMQENDTVTTTEQRCNTVFDVSERTVGYRVDYKIGDAAGQIQTRSRSGSAHSGARWSTGVERSADGAGEHERGSGAVVRSRYVPPVSAASFRNATFTPMSGSTCAFASSSAMRTRTVALLRSAVGMIAITSARIGSPGYAFSATETGCRAVTRLMYASFTSTSTSSDVMSTMVQMPVRV